MRIALFVPCYVDAAKVAAFVEPRRRYQLDRVDLLQRPDEGVRFASPQD